MYAHTNLWILKIKSTFSPPSIKSWQKKTTYKIQESKKNMARKWCVVVVLVVSQLFSTIFPMMDFRNFNGCSALLGWAQKSWSPAVLHSWLPRVLKTGVNFVSVVWRCQPVGGGGNSPARGGIQPWVGVFFSSPGFFFHRSLPLFGSHWGWCECGCESGCQGLRDGIDICFPWQQNRNSNCQDTWDNHPSRTTH